MKQKYEIIILYYLFIQKQHCLYAIAILYTG